MNGKTDGRADGRCSEWYRRHRGEWVLIRGRMRGGGDWEVIIGIGVCVKFMVRIDQTFFLFIYVLSLIRKDDIKRYSTSEWLVRRFTLRYPDVVGAIYTPPLVSYLPSLWSSLL